MRLARQFSGAPAVLIRDRKLTEAAAKQALAARGYLSLIEFALAGKTKMPNNHTKLRLRPKTPLVSKGDLIRQLIADI